MVKRSDEFARSRIPELGGFVIARRQDPSAIRTKRCLIERILMVERGDEFARSRIPEFGGFVRAPRQDLGTVGTKRRVGDLILMVKEAMSLPEAASQSLAVLSALPVRIRAPSGLNATS